tara:strand:+ start:219 stop:713 length:495 start_codon:yes stop_codon:yes gene_type:complete
MARSKKQLHSWNKVTPGDIISFRYKNEKTKRTLTHSVLVLNPRLPVYLKDGKITKHLIGIKLEQSNLINLYLNQRQILVMEQIGEFQRIDEDNQLYRLKIKDRFILNNRRGVKQEAYDKLARSLDIKGNYRTYDYYKAIKSAVYLEPIRVFTEIKVIDKDEDKL